MKEEEDETEERRKLDKINLFNPNPKPPEFLPPESLLVAQESLSGGGRSEPSYYEIREGEEQE